MVKKIVNLVGGALMCATLAANAQEEQPGPFSQGVSLITAVVQQTIPILLPIAEALAPAAEDTDEAIYMMMPGLGRKLLQKAPAPTAEAAEMLKAEAPAPEMAADKDAVAAVDDEMAAAMLSSVKQVRDDMVTPATITGGTSAAVEETSPAPASAAVEETSPAPASVEKKEEDMVAPAPAEEMVKADKPDKKKEMPMPPVPPPQEEMMMADKPDKKEEMPMPPVPPPQEEMMMADKKEEMPMPPVPPPQEEMMMADKMEEMPMPPVPPPQEEMMTDMAGPVEGLIAREAGPIAEALRALGSAPIGSFFETLFNQTLPAIGAALATPPTVTPVLTTGGPTASG